MDYCYRNTTEVYFAQDVISKVKENFKENGFHRAFILTGQVASKEIAEFIGGKLGDCFEVSICNGISTNPTDSKVDDAFRKAALFNPDVIVTVGGGSVHDCGKAISVLLCNSESQNVDDYTVTGRLSVSGIKKTLPIVTIPTLLGSGAEVSPAALLRIHDKKKVVYSPLLHPKATFVNVAFCRNAPLKVIVRSAFDSFIQALEGYISSAANEISNTFALGAITNYVSCIRNLSNGQIDDTTMDAPCPSETWI